MGRGYAEFLVEGLLAPAPVPATASARPKAKGSARH